MDSRAMRWLDRLSGCMSNDLLFTCQMGINISDSRNPAKV